MTVEKVIELGNIEYNTPVFSMDYWVWWLIIALLVGLQIVFWMFTSEETGGSLLGIGFLVFLLLLAVNTFDDDYQKSLLIEDWKKEVALPYISTLHEYNKEIVYLKIDPELSYSVSSYPIYTYSKEIQRTPLTVSFKDKGIVTVTNWFETRMELTNDTKPYVTYKQLDVNLGHDINKGMYDVKVYLPESYKFTDIK